MVTNQQLAGGHNYSSVGQCVTQLPVAIGTKIGKVGKDKISP